MISAVTGDVKQVDSDRAFIRVGAFVLELLVPASDIPELTSSLGQTRTLHTLCYLEGDPTRGNLEPRLIGFLRLLDKQFFEKFTTVKGIGPKTALKALTRPAGEIARAIEEKNARYLTGLKGIGKRTAELIIAELSGKLKDYAAFGGPAASSAAARSNAEKDALAGLVALGESPAAAEGLLDQVKRDLPQSSSPGDLLRECLRIRGG
jgi:holliday junction DNA helicase RuvA